VTENNAERKKTRGKQEVKNSKLIQSERDTHKWEVLGVGAGVRAKGKGLPLTNKGSVDLKEKRKPGKKKKAS